MSSHLWSPLNVNVRSWRSQLLLCFSFIARAVLKLTKNLRKAWGSWSSSLCLPRTKIKSRRYHAQLAREFFPLNWTNQNTAGSEYHLWGSDSIANKEKCDSVQFLLIIIRFKERFSLVCDFFFTAALHMHIRYVVTTTASLVHLLWMSFNSLLPGRR